MKKLYILLLAAISLNIAFAQTTDAVKSLKEQKKVNATRISQAPKIDGFVTEEVWKTSKTASNFVELSPEPLTQSDYTTDVRVLYDDAAIYISFMCYDESGDVVLRQLSNRDDFDNTDWVGVVFNSYRDGLNGEGFIVTASGVQMDVKYSAGNEDEAWNAVWESEAQILDNGWSVEIKIPFAALRFPDNAEQVWNINFVRSVRRTREESWWNPIDPKIDGLLNQSGLLTGLKDIKSPTRLFFYPYVASNNEHFPRNQDGVNNWSNSLNAGMDVKYGINDAFTLDMTLIPDFGQVRSDNQVLNLSPFEVVFDENRQFFTEGTELFNKGDLFYSRRIGAQPRGFYDVAHQINEDETILSNPSVTQLINSTKVSGRTNKGLGIGLFNSVSNAMHATIENTDGDIRKIKTEPLTNYNIAVLDQNFKNNSFLTLINTNVQRFGTADDANVGGTIFRFNDKTNTYSGAGRFIHSYQKNAEGEVSQGFQSSASLSKISGNFQISAANTIFSDKYDHNDLGIIFRNNSINNEFQMSYNIFEPFSVFNRARIRVSSFLSHRYDDRAFQDFAISLNYFSVTRSFFAFGIDGRLEPVETYDYFEPRVEGRYLAYPTNRLIGGWISSDYRKRFALDARANYRAFDQEGRRSEFLSIEPRFRVSDKLFFVYEWQIFRARNDIGYVNFQDDDKDKIIMGRRLSTTNTHELNAQYIFNNKAGLTFRMRHYWSKAIYNNFFLLGENGTLDPTDYPGYNNDGTTIHDVSFNAFNIDCIFNWQFAPGSFLTAVWKNAIFRNISNTEEAFIENLTNTIGDDQTNTFSVKALFFVDYLNAKSIFQKKG